MCMGIESKTSVKYVEIPLVTETSMLKSPVTTTSLLDVLKDETTKIHGDGQRQEGGRPRTRATFLSQRLSHKKRIRLSVNKLAQKQQESRLRGHHARKRRYLHQPCLANHDEKNCSLRYGRDLCYAKVLEKFQLL
ncbi:hypothetical protein TKK_0005572 [Trichogramma kaykai]